jgi:hypothetical protein
MGDEEKKQSSSNDSSIYYILGGVVLVAAVAGFFLLKPKATPPPTVPEQAQPAQQAETVPAVKTTPGPITKFACEKQYYNTVVGFPKYYLSAEGVDVNTTGEVTCDFTVSIKDKVVAQKQIKSQLTEAKERGGATFRCQTDAVELARNVATSVKVTMTNTAGQTTDCTQMFQF